MKKLILGLLTVLAFSLSSEAAPTKAKVKLESASTIDATNYRGPYAIGTHHRRLPRRAARVVINNRVYFVSNGVYFESARRGFVVVPQPRIYRPAPRYRTPNRGYRYTPAPRRGPRYNPPNRGNGPSYRNYGPSYRGGCRR